MKKTAPKGKITIDVELCKGCKFCIHACPKNVIVMDAKFNKKGLFPALPAEPDKCTGCALCAEMCPELAILVWKQ